MCARLEEEGIWVVVGGSRLIVLVTNIFLFLQAAVDDAVG